MTRRKLSLHSLILSIVLLLSLLVSVTLFDSKSIHASNSITVGDKTFDLDNLESNQVGEPIRDMGLTYTFYENGLCTITGEQNNYRRNSDNPLKNNTDVLVVYANYNPNGHKQSNMFYNCQAHAIVFGHEFKTTNVEDFTYMFRECDKLKVLDLSRFDTSSAKNMYGMFYGCSSLTELDVSDFNTGFVEDMSLMFYGCSNLTELDVSNFNTEKVTSMYFMFSGCSSLTELVVSNFNTGIVDDMGGMFNKCSSLTELDVSNFNTGFVEDMNQMFSGCSSLTELDLSNFNTGIVKDMRFMFSGCSSLTELDVSSFDTGSVTLMNTMFDGCSSLEALDVSNFNTESVKKMFNMFNGCSSLTELNVSNFNTGSVDDMSKMFSGCSSLTELDVSNFNTTNVTDIYGMFDNCTSLTTINLSNNFVITSDCLLVCGFGNYSDELNDLEDFDKFYNGIITYDELKTKYNLDDYYVRETYGLARNCPKLNTIVLDSNFIGFGDFENPDIFEVIFDDEEENFIVVENPSYDNYGPGRLFYTKQVNGKNVSLNFVVLSDNGLTEILGTVDDPYNSYYADDNRDVSVIRMSELDAFKEELVTKDFVNDKDINEDIFDKYQKINSYFKSLLKSDPTIVKDTKTYKDLINDLIDAYNDFTSISPEPEPEPEPKPKKTITTTQTITVEYVNVDKAYMNGYDDKTFRPNENITRAELSAVFSRLLNNDIDKEDYTKYSAKYNDLSLNWYHNYIGYLTNRNIFDGYNDNTFKPQNSMTKAEFAKSIVKMFNVKMNKSNNVDNKEIDGRWYKDYLDIMISNYYIDSNYIKTCNEPITRKEVCYIVNVAKGRKVKTKETLTKEESDYIKNNYKDLNENDPYFYHIVSALLDMK